MVQLLTLVKACLPFWQRTSLSFDVLLTHFTTDWAGKVPGLRLQDGREDVACAKSVSVMFAQLPPPPALPAKTQPHVVAVTVLNAIIPPGFLL